MPSPGLSTIRRSSTFAPTISLTGRARPGLRLVRRSIEEARPRRSRLALSTSLAAIPDTVTEPRVFTYRAGLLLAVGRVDEADPRHRRGHSRLAPTTRRRSRSRVHRGCCHRTTDRSARSLADAGRAGAIPASAAAHLALSYAQQAAFDLDGALASAAAGGALQPGQRPRARAPRRALAVARRPRPSLDEADGGGSPRPRNRPRADSPRLRSPGPDPACAKPREAFERAIAARSGGAPCRAWPRPAQIRGGDLEEGRQELEIAVSLDPGDSLLRSYLGKAYYEERQPVLAADQFKLAQDLDPNDPTPWLYDAIRLQSVNRPVEALESLQTLHRAERQPRRLSLPAAPGSGSGTARSANLGTDLRRPRLRPARARWRAGGR